MDEDEQAKNLLSTFVKANSTCCECNAVLTDDATYINIHIGITLCKDCMNVLAYLEGDFAHNYAYSGLLRMKFPLHLALYLKQTGNQRNKELFEFNKPVWYITPSECNSDVIRDMYFREKYLARRFFSREQDLKLIRKKLEEAKGMDESAIEEYLESLADNYDRFWYYLEEKTMQPTKKGPYTRKEMGDLFASHAIREDTFVWHPCIGGWIVAAHASPLQKTRRELPKEVVEAIDVVHRDNNLQPVRLLQGYLHLQRKKQKDQWKSKWVTMTKESLCYSDHPGGKLKNDVKFLDSNIQAKLLISKSNALSIYIETGSGKSMIFWSPFQKEVLEWIIELRKIKFILSFGGSEAETLIIQPSHASSETNLTESPYYKIPPILMGFVYFRLASKKGKKRQKRWGVLKSSQIIFYKSYQNYYSVCVMNNPPSSVKTLVLDGIQLESRKERDDEYGFNLRVRSSSLVSYDLWMETLKEYELWAEYLENLTSASPQ